MPHSLDIMFQNTILIIVPIIAPVATLIFALILTHIFSLILTHIFALIIALVITPKIAPLLQLFAQSNNHPKAL